MPQLQLPIFPAGITEINKQIAVEKREGMVYYVHGHLLVFQHGEGDVRPFGMFTSQMPRASAVRSRAKRPRATPPRVL
jgi:hypothetical protein